MDASGDGTGPRPLVEEPFGVSVDGTGNLFVASAQEDLVIRFSPAGVGQVVIDASGDGAGHALDRPVGTAVDSAGNLYVTGGFSDNVFKVTPAGGVTQVLDASGADGFPFDGPGDMAVGPDDEVYVVGGSSQNVFRIDASGAASLLTSWFSPAFPTGVAADAAGNVYVSVDGSNTAYKIAPGGVRTQILPSGSVVEPLGIAADAAGNVYVSGLGSGNVYHVSPGGVATEILDGLASGPRALELDGAGNLFIAVSSSNVILRRDAVTGVVTTVATGTSAGVGKFLSFPHGLTHDPSDGAVYASGRFSDNVVRIDPGGAVTEVVHRNWDTSTHPLEGPSAVVTDPAGNTFVVGRGSANVFRVPPNGAIEVALDVTGDGAGHEVRVPERAAVDTAGNVFVTDAVTRSVFRIAPGGAIAAVVVPADGLFPNDVAVDAAGNAYVASCTTDNVVRVSPGGTITEIIGPAGDGAGHTLNCPTAMAVAEDGTAYVSGFLAVFRVETGGDVTRILDATGDGSLHPFDGAVDLVADGLGGVYVADLDGNTVFHVSSAGSVTAVLDGDGDHLAHPLFEPQSLAIDRFGSVFVRSSDALFRVTRNGHVILMHETPANQPNFSAFTQRSDVAADATGDLIATSYIENQVFRVEFECPPVPLPECRRSTVPLAGKLQLKDKDPETKDGLRWTWSRGAATTAADFGDPLVDDAFQICLYDESTSVPLRALEARAPAGGTCGTQPCWRALGGGKLLYSDRAALGGVKKLLLVPGAAGAAKFVLKGLGDQLLLPSPPYALSLRMQLASTTGVCWESYFHAGGVIRNEPTQFRGKDAATP